MIVYMLGGAGIPVYFHYCGGELEKINYLVKGNSCCGSDEDQSNSDDNGCCSDEQIVLRSAADFDFKFNFSSQFSKAVQHLFYTERPFTCFAGLPLHYSNFIVSDPVPKRLQQEEFLSTFMLRI